MKRIEHSNYRIFVGYYRNDPATAAAIASVVDDWIESVVVEADGPTTKADCLNYLYDALIAHELATGQATKAVVLYDAEDVVHPLELSLFDRLIDRAGVIQLPVLPLIDPGSNWISGHYCDEFAEAHAKEMVVREAVGGSIPLARVGCAIARDPLARLAAMHEGRPFVGGSMTEDHELGVGSERSGPRPCSCASRRLRATGRSSPAAVISHRASASPSAKKPVGSAALRWPPGTGWAGAAAWASGGCGCATGRGPLAAVLLLSAYGAAFLWSQVWRSAPPSKRGSTRPWSLCC